MATPKKTISKSKKEEQKKTVPRKPCSKCQKSKRIEYDYYMSTSIAHEADSRVGVCKVCIKEMLGEDYINNIENVHNVLRMLDKPFIFDAFQSAIVECQARGMSDIFGIYIKSLWLNNKHTTWSDSSFSSSNKFEVEDTKNIHKQDNQVIVIEPSKIIDNKNEEDVLRMLGYDPFESENPSDRKYLFDRLVDFLDESTLEDSFKLPAVIEIVKSFNQIDKLNSALSSITADVKSVAQNVGGIKSLMDTKGKMLKSVLDLAKDNGISVNHNNNKSKGSGTLSGIIKTLQEKGFSEVEANIFNIDTASGMKQVADISHRSILDQLQFDENDYAEMLAEQRSMINDLESKVHKLEEENRLLKIELKSVKQNER